MAMYHMEFLAAFKAEWDEKQLTIVDFQHTLEHIEKTHSKRILAQVNSAL